MSGADGRGVCGRGMARPSGTPYYIILFVFYYIIKYIALTHVAIGHIVKGDGDRWGARETALWKVLGWRRGGLGRGPPPPSRSGERGQIDSATELHDRDMRERYV